MASDWARNLSLLLGAMNASIGQLMLPFSLGVSAQDATLLNGHWQCKLSLSVRVALANHQLLTIRPSLWCSVSPLTINSTPSVYSQFGSGPKLIPFTLSQLS